MTFLEPYYLALLIPLAFAFRHFLPPPGWRRWLRFAVLVFLVLALARVSVRLPRRGGTLVVLADRSASMPADASEIEQEVIRRLEASRGGGDRLAVVAFGRRAAVELRPGAGKLQRFTADVGAERSDLASALKAALALLGAEGDGRILAVTDGRYTGRDPAGVAGRAALGGVPVDYRLLERPATGDVAVESVDAPLETSPGEGFVVTAWVRSPARGDVDVELRRGDRVIAQGHRTLAAGRNRLTFRDRAASSGVRAYTLTVRGQGADPLPENNAARFLVGVQGPRPLLVVDTGGGELAELLRGAGLDVDRRPPHEIRGSLESLAGYSAVLLQDVPASDVGDTTMRNLAAWVRGAGGGLMMTGGQDAYGPGGYFRSPLEDVLPVSMELRQEHRTMSLAMAVALDRSGSMAASVGGGRTKMDLANLATVEVLGLLSPFDELAVIAVDSQPHIIAPLKPVGEAPGLRQEILSIDSLGGGIFVYEALHAAVEQLLKSEAGTRHVILFADAADSENPAEYRQLLARARAAAITVSVVGLGTEADVDAEFLRDVARRGGGRIFFTDSPQALPRLFAQETFVVARSSFVDVATPWRTTAGLLTLAGRTFTEPPALGGYNLTYLRPEAQLAAVTRDDYEAPVVAAWQVGLGRSVAYTGQVGGRFRGAAGSWSELGELLASLARWTAGESEDLGQEMMVTEELDRGLVRIRLHLDPDRGGDPFTELPRALILTGVPGETPEKTERPLSWIDPDTLEAEVELGGDEVALTRLEVPGRGAAALPPVRLPYSPELAPSEPGSGHLVLEGLASSTGGRQRIDVGDVWRDFPRRPRFVELTPWLFGLVLLTFLLEVLERRTALLTSRTSEIRATLGATVEKRKAKPVRQRMKRPRKEDRVEEEPSPAEEEPAVEPAPEEEGAAVLSALDQARHRAGRRTRR